MLLQSFYHRLNIKASEHLDAAAKGSFLSLTTRQANKLMQKISENQGWTQKNTQQCCLERKITKIHLFEKKNAGVPLY
jgi:hypothetical protein